MLRNVFTVAFRNLLRGGVYSFINIVGLATGICCFVLIALYIQYEYSYDKDFPFADRLYRVTTKLGSYETKDAPLPLFHVLKERFPEVENSSRLFWIEPPYPYFSPDEENMFQETRAYYADSTVFDVLGVQVLYGDRSAALTQTNSVALSVSAAKRYFGSEDVVNRTLRFNNDSDLKVTAVFRDFPYNSHLHPDILISAVTNRLMIDNSSLNWEWLYPSSTYIRLRDDADITKINESLGTLFFDVTGYTREQYNADYNMKLQSVSDIHLTSNFPGENNGNVTTIVTFGFIGVIILAIAVINFVNLNTVRSFKRSREIGMRKALGSKRMNLVVQFLIESVVTVMLAAIISFLMTLISVRAFNDLIGTSLDPALFINVKSITFFALFIVALGIVSGLYPALVLSRQNTVNALKGKGLSQASAARFMKVLVVGQFMIGFVVLTGTFVINRQLKFMMHQDLGFNKSNIICIELPNDSIGVDMIRDEIKSRSHVITASKMSESFNNVQGWYVPWYEGAPPERDFSVTRFHTDHNFKDLAGLQMIAGRFFNEDFRGDSLSYVLNETAIRKLGWTAEEAVGKLFGSELNQGKVIGIVQDFNFRHLSTPITPFVFYPPSKKRNVYERGKIFVRFEEGFRKQALADISNLWEARVPKWPFKYSYLDGDLDQQYIREAQLSKMTVVFSILAIFIAALGLFALTSFSISQRIREIGIRKVLGASTVQLVFITSKGFIVLVCIGIAFGIPISFMMMDSWLEGYAFRVSYSIYPFITSFMISFSVALLTVIVVSWRAAWQNPVKAITRE